MNIHCKLALGVAAITLAALAPAAYANPVVISTDRAQIRLNDGGGVQIRSTGISPVVLNSQRTAPQPNWSVRGLTPLPTTNWCWPRANTVHHVQRHSSHANTTGETVYSENRSSTLVCQ
jgi:hypothetical protein